MLRSFLIILLLISSFIFPSYLTALFIFLGVLFFNNFIEAVFFGFLLDILYGGNTVFGFRFHYFFLLLFAVIYLISPKIKKMLKFYSH